MSPRRAQHRAIGLLDIGSAKVAAAIVVMEPSDSAGPPGLRLAGLGMQRSAGVKAGLLTDLDAAESAVRAAIAQAERAAGLGIDSVAATVSCGRLASSYFTAHGDVENGVVSDGDIGKAYEGARAYAERNGRMLVHLNTLSYGLDGFVSHSYPRGLAARRLSARMHAVTADELPLRNLLLLVERCRLDCDGLIATPYASGLAVTTAEERGLGAIVIDMGAGTTSAAMFSEGRLVAVEVVPVGAQHITFDIAKALQAQVGEAERIKTLYGTLVSAQSDQHETFTYALAGDEDGATFDATRAQLAAIIRPRIAQTFAALRDKLAVGGRLQPGQHVVLTGGGSQIIGAADFAASFFSSRARLGRPMGISGVPTSGATGPIAAVLGLAVGLRDGSVTTGLEAGIGTQRGDAAGSGYFGLVGSWLRNGF